MNLNKSHIERRLLAVEKRVSDVEDEVLTISTTLLLFRIISAAAGAAFLAINYGMFS